MTDPTSALSALDLPAYGGHREFVRSLAFHLVRDPSDGEDVCQEAWLAALERPPRDASSARAWLTSTPPQDLREASPFRRAPADP